MVMYIPIKRDCFLIHSCTRFCMECTLSTNFLSWTVVTVVKWKLSH